MQKLFIKFAAVMLLLSTLGGYQLAQLISGVNESSAQRSVQLFEIEESLDDAAIGLGRQVQEWKNLLLRSNDKDLYLKHQRGFKDASIGVQYALLNAKNTMGEIGMDTAAIDRLIVEHKALLAEYLQAYSTLKPASAESSNAVDARIVGIDRKLQHDITSVKAGISEFAKQQLYRAPETQGNRYLMLGLLGATSLFFMSLFGFGFARFLMRR